jgi:hypothetical protein
VFHPVPLNIIHSQMNATPVIMNAMNVHKNKIIVLNVYLLKFYLMDRYKKNNFLYIIILIFLL